MPALVDLTLLNSDGSPFDGTIPVDAQIGDVIAIISGVSPTLTQGSTLDFSTPEGTATGEAIGIL
jgi:hypothetical protein